MEALFLFATIIAVDGRAVNVSTAWLLPQEGFSAFYRYFPDKLTWNSARALCNSHHADLLSVQTTAHMDAARAYLKEMDVAAGVWIGLQRESPEEAFSWTNGERLLGDDNWMEPAPKSVEKLCVAMEPAGDFRWSVHYCGGPEVNSFVCEISVPEWAEKENGCLTSSLPSLTVTLMPEAGVIQLLSDCGSGGTRRLACNERSNREEVIKHLSCDVDAFASTIPAGSTTAGATRQINNRNPHDTTRSYRPLTRHRRSAPSAAPPNAPPLKQTTPKPNKHLPHVFPHSPYLSSERNSPATKPPLRPPPHKPLPVLLITANDSLPSAVPDNPPIVLMVEDKNLDGPFFFPLAEDIIVNDPSLSPLEIVSVDLVEMDNVTAKSGGNVRGPARPGALSLGTPSGAATEGTKSEVPQGQKGASVVGPSGQKVAGVRMKRSSGWRAVLRSGSRRRRRNRAAA